ncbi:MAG: aminotransferase class I/II-fold pyridoxal phosphate-dependent enzyme [Ruminococcaceae bacterium]|nr:aminotransferase class I/II-fold pyridoxal phosphate-dependent enzyme [Oscillospiraceae bacterium]
MNRYENMTVDELRSELSCIHSKLSEFSAKGLNLDLTRGKPGNDQLAISEEMLGVISSSEDCVCENGTDCRNYGVLDGIPEAKRLFSELLEIPERFLIVEGNSSLNIMFDTVARAMLFGVYGGKKPWGQQGEIKFLCPSPGYDRHFAICEAMGIKMIPVDMTPDGPDMDAVERLVSSDSSIKGIWCVPKFSNPEGYTYSDETVERFARLKPAADDFRIFWDNAYAVHEIYDEKVELLDIFKTCEKYGTEDSVFYFASTSKISFPGSGVAIMAASENNLIQIKPILSAQTIGFDKINQMRHVKYFKDAAGVHAHMKRHADIIRPRFEAVIGAFRRELQGIATWTEPKGGYFVNLTVPDGCAKRVFRLAADSGVTLTKAGASFPYGNDPCDRHLRIAPTYPSFEDLVAAVDILCLCVKAAALEKMLAD